MEVTYKDVVNNCLIDCAHDQIAITCSVDAKERGGVKKLLGLSAECKVINAEAMKNEAKITGKVCYKVIYIDKENKTCGLDYFCDFNETITGYITPVDVLSVKSSVVDVSGRIEDDAITLTAVCDFVLTVIGKNESKAVDVAQGVYTEREMSSLVRLTSLKENTFEVVAEEESGSAVDKVLYFNTIPLITSVTKNDVGAVVEGLVQTEIVYIGEDTVKGKSFVTPFSEEIEADGLADVTATIKSNRLVLSGDQTNNVFEVQAYVTIGGYDVNVTDVELVTDAFSTTNNLDIENEYLPCKRFVGSQSFDFPITSDAEIEDLSPSSTVLATPVLRVNVANAISGQNEVTVEGLAVATILYLSEDRVNSVQVELPFSVTEKADGISPSDSLTVDAIITDFQANFMSGIVNLRAMLKARINVYKTYRLKWISSIKECEPKLDNQNGISIYYVNGFDSVWDIAKAVNMSPDEILAMNPDLETPTGEKRRVTVFRKRRK